MEEITTQLRAGIKRAKRERKNSQGNGKEILSIQDQRDLESLIALDFAKESGTWIPDFYALGHPFSNGNENTICILCAGQIVYKSNNLFNSLTISALFERIKLHNLLFPETAYTFVGFTGIDHSTKRPPYIEVILKQDYIHNTTPARPQEIQEYMYLLGFKLTSKASYSNGEYTVSDLFPRNVLKSTKDYLYVVDAEIKIAEQSK